MIYWKNEQSQKIYRNEEICKKSLKGSKCNSFEKDKKCKACNNKNAQ